MKVAETHPGLEEEFKNRFFGIKRTAKPFSRQPVDLTLEQTINADAARRLTGIVQLTDSITARQRWARSHDIRSTVITNILEEVGLGKNQDISAELQPSNIKKSTEQLENFIKSFNQYINPFSHDLPMDQLFNIASGKAASIKVEKFLLNIEEIDKCEFFVCQVKFLGFLITEDGISPTNEKIKAIQEAPAPTSKLELQAFLGMQNFFHLFLENKATVAEPLHKGISWKWTTEEQDAFDKLKRMLSSSKNLAHYDEKKALVLTCDASPYGVGAVLSHLDECGKEVPIAFHSRTLSKVIPPRMLRWILILSSYDYKLVYVPGTQIPHADALSRFPLTSQDIEGPPLQEVLMLESVPEKSFTAEEIAKKTKEDRILSKVSFWIQTGWTDDKNKVPEELKQFWQKRNELSMYNGCLLWGNRVIIPPIETNQVLQILHATHPGIVRMKALARHARLAPYHPASNGQAERMVQTTKHFLKMLKDGDIKTKPARFLMQQHSTPISTTGNSPADILMNRKLLTRLSSLHPKVLETSKKQTLEEDAPEVLRQFRAKDPVEMGQNGVQPSFKSFWDQYLID
ncbi:hypothetical protein JTB14_003385 [Gonioctena quinquepunctata]|nr:hypothetical protein JTB14_003385 [Gonioctena quinquepunctata]